MEDEITKRELSDDELDNVSGGGCEENARNCCPDVYKRQHWGHPFI